MKKHFLKRALALILTLLMLPITEAFAAEDVPYEFSVRFSDICSDRMGSAAMYEFSGDGYYISPSEAARMLGMKLDGEKFCGADGNVIVEPKLYYIPSKAVGTEKVYRFNELMNELYTYAFVSGSGEIAFNSAAANLDSLICETNRIVKGGTYTADVLRNMDGNKAAVGFAWLYDAIWNAVEKISGKTTARDYHDYLMKLMQPCDNFENLAEIAEKSAKFTEKLSEYALKGQEYYDGFFNELDLSAPGYGYLLFGIDNTGNLRECMEAIKGVEDNYYFAGSNLISAGSRLLAVKEVSEMYGNALENVLDNVNSGGARWKSMKKGLTYKAGMDSLRDYKKYKNDYRGYILGDGAKILAEEWISKQINDNLEEALYSSPALILKKSIDFLDPYLLKINKKNDAVRDISILTDIQTYFVYAYNRSGDIADPAERAKFVRDCTLLYLKSAWLAYDTVKFDKEVSGAVKRMQKDIETQISVVADYPDSAFYCEAKTDILEGELTMNRPKTAPKGVDAGKYHDLFTQYIKSYEWLQYATYDYSSYPKEDYGKVQWGEYYFCDVDKDGIDELIIHSGTSHADGNAMVFSAEGKKVTFRGLVNCAGLGSSILVSENNTGFILYEVQQGWGMGQYCDFVGREIRLDEYRFVDDETLPDGWNSIMRHEIPVVE